MDEREFEINRSDYSDLGNTNDISDADIGETFSSKSEAEKRKQEDDSSNMGLYDWLQCVVTALLFGMLIFLFVGRLIGVDGSSMYPTLYDKDKVIISNLFYTPQQGDVIVLQTDTFGEEPLVKRIIALGGQTVNINFETGVVYVDGAALQEDYIAEPTYTQEDFSGPITVPDGYVFVMGDNRNASTDSRSNMVGMVDERCILGKVYWIAFPGAGSYDMRDFSRIGSVYN